MMNRGWKCGTQAAPSCHIFNLGSSHLNVALTTMHHLYNVTLATMHTHTHTHTRLTALCPGLPGWAGTRKVKPIWSLLKQETVSGSGISWVICKSAPRSRQITTPAPHHSVFYRPDALSAAQPTASKHWRQLLRACVVCILFCAVFSSPQHCNVLRRIHQEESQRQRRPAVVGDGVLRRRLGQRPHQVGEGQLAAWGLDCLHLQGGAQRAVPSALTQSDPPRHQGTERPTYWQRRGQARSVCHCRI